MRFKLAPIAAAAAALAMALTGCAGSSSGGDQQAPKDLVLGNIVAPATFQASAARWPNDSVYLQAAYDPLVKIAANGTDVEPNLATKWSYNEDKTVLTLTLRSDVKFTDGTPFTAEIAAQNLLRYKNGTGNQASLLADVTDVKATDPTTLVITLKQADPALLIALGQAAGLVESPKAFDAPDVKTNPVGTGPYVLDTGKTVVGSSYVYTKNPDYWNPSSVHYDSVTVKVLTDPSAMLNALRGKQLNAGLISDNTIIDQVKSAGYTTIEQQPNFTGLMLLDRAGKINPALANVKVRQAINHAIDRDAMLKAIGKGHGSTTQQVFRPDTPGFDESLESTYGYDPAKAKQLLTEAGYANGVTLTLPTSAGQGSDVWPLLQQQLGEVGIKTEFVDVGQNLIADLLGGKYAAGYIQLRRDPAGWFNVKNLLAPNAVWNPFKYQDPKVDQLIATIRSSSGDTQSSALKELNKHIVEQAWFNPWYAGTSYFASDKKTNVTLSLASTFPNIWDFKPAA
jgi:peptide/nickel transport system substrate-binding protein